MTSARLSARQRAVSGQRISPQGIIAILPIGVRATGRKPSVTALLQSEGTSAATALPDIPAFFC
jgi:hypothetical protein